jgi:crotonobetainyl-CoA:carnitine CoA-transferase CaiB-like acyl-CoA transferase
VKNPKPASISFGDHLTGFSAGYGILAALYRSAATGEGQKVETSLLQSMVAFVSEAAAQYFETGKVPEVDGRGGRVRQAHCFLGSDGLPFAIHLSSPLKFWKGLTEAVGKPELYEDPRFFDREPRARNYDLLHDMLQEVFATAPRQTWVERLRAHDVPSGPLYTLPEVFQDPQVKSWGLPVELKRPGGGSVRIGGNPVRLSETPVTYELAPPALGEHTREVLRSLGCGNDELERLARSGVI